MYYNDDVYDAYADDDDDDGPTYQDSLSSLALRTLWCVVQYKFCVYSL